MRCGLPCTLRKTQLPCPLPGETKAIRSPAIVQKATNPIAARMPSDETSIPPVMYIRQTKNGGGNDRKADPSIENKIDAVALAPAAASD